MTKLTDHGVRSIVRIKSQEIVEGLRDLAATLQAGQPLESRFTVRGGKPGRSAFRSGLSLAGALSRS